MRMFALVRFDQAEIFRAVISPLVKIVTEVVAIRPTPSDWQGMGVRATHVCFILDGTREAGVKIAEMKTHFPYLNVFKGDCDLDVILRRYGLKRD